MSSPKEILKRSNTNPEVLQPYVGVTNGTEISTTKLYETWISGNLELSYTPGMSIIKISESKKLTVPRGQKNPQKCPYNLYCQQISYTPFTFGRSTNRYGWQYKILPSVSHKKYQEYNKKLLMYSDFSKCKVTPQQMRWNPLPGPSSSEKVMFFQSLVTVCGAGSVESKSGMAVHLYACNESMINESFINSDGEMLIVPQQGTLLIRTEYGIMEIPVGFIGVIPRGCQFSVMINNKELNQFKGENKGFARGYISEVFEGTFILPDRGVTTNGLANEKDIQGVVSSFEDTRDIKWQFYHKFQGKMFVAERTTSPYDVVGWSSNMYPYRYNLADFVAINSVTVDHPDPSIYTVLTCQTSIPGAAACDFVIFPPRWQVAQNTFRPPWYHLNCMSEYMGNIFGVYEAKSKGFLPGGGSLHSAFAAHGPDNIAFDVMSGYKGNKNLNEITPPITSALAFMFESYYMLKLTPFALKPGYAQEDYNKVSWSKLSVHYNPRSKL